MTGTPIRGSIPYTRTMKEGKLYVGAMFNSMMERSLLTRRSGTTALSALLLKAHFDFGFDHVECYLSAIEWFGIKGFSDDDLHFLTDFVRSNACFISELAERQKNGAAVA